MFDEKLFFCIFTQVFYNVVEICDTVEKFNCWFVKFEKQNTNNSIKSIQKC